MHFWEKRFHGGEAISYYGETIAVAVAVAVDVAVSVNVYACECVSVSVEGGSSASIDWVKNN